MVASYPVSDLRCSEASPPPFARTLRALRAPALVVNGAEDSAQRRAAGAALARMLPGARYALVAGAGHIPSLDAPGAYCELLTEFLCLHVRATGASAAPRADRSTAEKRT
jgi:pimeloyl-ACP methyl ester carboxylesterase